VTDAAVALDRSPTGSHRIVAFVVAGQSSPTPIARIEAEAQQRLPAHMRPSRIVSVDALPMTLNGKIDRDALLALERRTPRGLASPASPVETTIAELWQQVLCVEAVGIDEPFFQLGGRSLQLMRIHAGLERTFGRKIGVAEMFSRPTVRELAQLIEAPTAERPVPDEARLRADKRRAAMARRAGLPARVMAR
jgi:acyl carrier protein